MAPNYPRTGIGKCFGIFAHGRVRGYGTDSHRLPPLMDGKVDARTLAAEILARRRAQRG